MKDQLTSGYVQLGLLALAFGQAQLYAQPAERVRARCPWAGPSSLQRVLLLRTPSALVAPTSTHAAQTTEQGPGRQLVMHHSTLMRQISVDNM